MRRDKRKGSVVAGRCHLRHPRPESSCGAGPIRSPRTPSLRSDGEQSRQANPAAIRRVSWLAAEEWKYLSGYCGHLCEKRRHTSDDTRSGTLVLRTCVLPAVGYMSADSGATCCLNRTGGDHPLRDAKVKVHVHVHVHVSRGMARAIMYCMVLSRRPRSLPSPSSSSVVGHLNKCAQLDRART